MSYFPPAETAVQEALARLVADPTLSDRILNAVSASQKTTETAKLAELESRLMTVEKAKDETEARLAQVEVSIAAKPVEEPKVEELVETPAEG